MFVQAGPIVNVHIPKDKVTGIHQGFGFVEFRTEADSDYAIKVMNMIKFAPSSPPLSSESLASKSPR